LASGRADTTVRVFRAQDLVASIGSATDGRIIDPEAIHAARLVSQRRAHSADDPRSRVGRRQYSWRELCGTADGIASPHEIARHSRRAEHA
ncbi:MAG: hypothetical protein AAB353_01490, partial [Candidatus Hydrogenedentota bacterium]